MVHAVLRSAGAARTGDGWQGARAGLDARWVRVDADVAVTEARRARPDAYREGMQHHLAQVNIALAREPLDSPTLRPFVDLLDEVNALADASPGFVWRLQTEDGNATAVRGFADDDVDGRLIINLSVWESFDALAGYVYGGPHLAVMRRRREWFERLPRQHVALWWLPAGSVPTVTDAERRVAVLRAEGATPFAFTFRDRFPPPTLGDQRHVDDRWGCPTG
jgi:hypothetical protein